MSEKYKVWDKETNVIVPTGKVFTPREWISLHPVCGLDGVKVVMGGGLFNGSMLEEFEQMKERYERSGCNLSECVTDKDYTDAFEEFDNRPIDLEEQVTTEERIAAALEFLALSSLDNI